LSRAFDRLPTLIVVDHGAASATTLREQRTVLAGRSKANAPSLRFVLHERHADARLGRWADLSRPDELTNRGGDSLLDPSAPPPVLSLHAFAHCWSR